MDETFKEKSFKAQDVILNCNRVAMEHLRQGNITTTFQLLKKAQDILEQPIEHENKSKLKAITFNNLGCFYKKTGKVGLALKFLQKALDLNISSPAEKTNLAGTHLNICAIHSTIGNHEIAIQHALKAIQFLKDAEESEFAPSIGATMAIAYHNAGVEYEFLKELARAEDMYKLGLERAEKNIGMGYNITESLISCYENIRAVRETLTKKPSKFYFDKKKAKSLRSVSERDNYRSNSSHEKKKKVLLPELRKSSIPSRRKAKSKSFDYSYSPDINIYGNQGNQKQNSKQSEIIKRHKSPIRFENLLPGSPIFPLKEKRPSSSARNIFSKNENDTPLLEVLEKLRNIESQSPELHGKRKVQMKEVKDISQSEASVKLKGIESYSPNPP